MSDRIPIPTDAKDNDVQAWYRRGYLDGFKDRHLRLRGPGERRPAIVDETNVSAAINEALTKRILELEALCREAADVVRELGRYCPTGTGTSMLTDSTICNLVFRLREAGKE